MGERRACFAVISEREKFKNGVPDGTADAELTFVTGSISNWDNASFVNGNLTGMAKEFQRQLDGDVWVSEGYYEEGKKTGTFKQTCTYENGDIFVFEGEFI